MSETPIVTSGVWKRLQKQYAKHSGSKFIDTLSDSLRKAILTAIPNSTMRGLCFRGEAKVYFQCVSCSKPMFSTSRKCHKLCGISSESGLPVSQVRKLLQEADWKLLKVLPSHKYERECRHCGRKEIRHLKYIVKKFSCRCQVGKKIANASRLDEAEFLSKVARHIKILGTYQAMNKKIEAKCLIHNVQWSTSARNLYEGRGCVKCGVEKMQQTNLEKYGCKGAIGNKNIQAKAQRTMLERHGVRHALQSKRLADKAFKHKDYILGKRTIRVQGYEPLALDWILANKSVKPNQIVCGIGSELPCIQFEHNGRKRVYHPDIFIPHLNMIVEVKSKFTYRYRKELNLAKKRACKKLGYKFVFLVMNPDGSRNYDYKNRSDKRQRNKTVQS